MEALVSIHDVMPETLERVEALISLADSCGVCALTLLVVPGKDWSEQQLDRLKKYQDQGYELAAHGMYHRASEIQGVYHRLYSTLISGDVAEHLCLDKDDISSLMQASSQWFLQKGLLAPKLYVPPAWALGPLPGHLLAALPYEKIEILQGIVEVESGRRVSLPLVGFEAGSGGKRFFLGLWNHLQLSYARFSDKPLRIALHPDDLQLDLSSQVRHILAGCGPSLYYQQVFFP